MTDQRPTDSVEKASSTDEHSKVNRPDDSLPPVEPPTATFILQLFLIPLAIVSMVVLVWLMFSWMAQMGRDNPDQLVSQLRKLDDPSWQRAYELAELLRSSDPAYAKLRKDEKLADELVSILENDLKFSDPKEITDARIQRRVYLCRAIGSFELASVLPILCKAAIEPQKLVDGEDVEVRIAALEGLAMLASNLQVSLSDAEKAKLLSTVIACSESKSPSTQETNPAGYIPQAEVRAVAAYTLGVIDGDEATARLKKMLVDTYSNARYNAATGLARRGDVAAIPVLKEMLDPENELSARDESNPNDQDRKRVNVVLTGIQATMTLHKVAPDADISELVDRIDQLRNHEFKLIISSQPRIQSIATEAIQRLKP